MRLKPDKYRSTKAQAIADERTRAAFEDQAQRMEQLARDIEKRIAASTAPDPFKPGMTLFFWGTHDQIPAGWSEVVELRGRYPRGMNPGDTPGTLGGAISHKHGSSTDGINGLTAPNGDSSSGYNMRDGTGASVTLQGFPHNHKIAPADHLDPHLLGIWIRKD